MTSEVNTVPEAPWSQTSAAVQVDQPLVDQPLVFSLLSLAAGL